MREKGAKRRRAENGEQIEGRAERKEGEMRGE